jgi:uncharacterized protein YjgD (DUF1641 family)
MSTVATDSSAAEKLQERLNDPKVADSLNRLLDRLDTVAFAVESLDGLISRGEVIADSISTTVGDLKKADIGLNKELLEKAPQMIETGTKLAEAAGAMNLDELAKSRILERLTDPVTLETLNQLLDRLPLAAFLLESLEGFIARGETIAENVTGVVAELKRNNIQIDTDALKNFVETLPRLAVAGEQLIDSGLADDLPKIIDAGVGMVDSGMLDKDVVSVLGQLGKQAADTYSDIASRPVEPVGGLFATLKATKDPDVQKSMGFFFAFAKAFAKHLQ